MNQRIDIGIVSLGVMGQRMLGRLAEHPRTRPLLAWDPNPAVVEEVRKRYPDLRIAADAAEVIAAPGLACLYIASPPANHLDYANAAFDAGLAVFCEKPLTVDFAAGRRTIARIAAENRRAAVNYSLATSPGLAAMRTAVADGSIGEAQRIEIELAFERWPRPWQAAAGRWLSERVEGGFSREVLSHFIFALQRVFGQATVESSQPDYPADGVSAETGLKARLSLGGLPLTVDARVGGGLPDSNRLSLIGSRGTVELHDWFGVRRRQGEGAWQPQETPQANREIGQKSQLDQLLAMIEGKEHSLPSFAEALAVQETIEALLKGR